MFAPKVFANINRPFYLSGLSGLCSTILLGVLAYKSIVVGEISLAKSVENQEDCNEEDDEKIKTD